jgi:hypothetical protein
MITQRAAGPGTAQAEELLDSAIGRARSADREDLVERLTRTRRSLRDRTVLVLLAGGTQHGRTALGHALRCAATGSSDVVFIDEATPEADAVLFLADAGRELTGAELEPLQSVSGDRRAVLLALSYVDLHPCWPLVLQADLARLSALGVPAEPFAVSTRLHAVAAGSQDQELDAGSGIPALAGRLRDLAGHVAASRARTVAHEVLRVLTELDSGTSSEPEPSTMQRPRPRPARSPGRKPAPDKLRPEGRPPWSRVLRDGFAAVSSDIDFDLRTRARTVLVEAERIIDDGDPTVDWTGFDAWLRDRLGHEVRQTYALLAARAAAVAAAVADRLGAPVSHVPPPLPTHTDLFEHVPYRGPTDGGRPLAARSRTMLSSAYGGVMMTFVLPRLAGLAIPTWILGSAALLAAAALTAATLTGERKRQLDRRRSQAKSIVRHNVDGFLLSAGKHTRDGIRSIHQQLRDDATARAEAGRPRLVEPAHRPRPVEPAGRTTPQPADVDHAALRRQALNLLGSTSAAAKPAAHPTSISA